MLKPCAATGVSSPHTVSASRANNPRHASTHREIPLTLGSRCPSTLAKSGRDPGGSICNASGVVGQASEGAGQLPYPHSAADRRHWALVLGAGHKSPADPDSAGRRGEPAWEAAAGWWRRSLGPRRA